MYKFLLLIAPLTYYNILTFISLIVFSLGFYSDEINAVGYHNGSISFFSLFLLLSIFSYYLVWKAIPNRLKDFSFKLKHKKEVIWISILFLLYYAIPIFIYKPTFILGINRYAFSDLPYVALFNIKLFLAILSFIWGAYASREEKKLSIFTFLWFSFIIISFSYGEKSSGVIDSIIYFICGLLLFRNKEIKLKTFTILLLLIISFPFILFTFQLFILQIPISELSDAFLIRLARQGQVFWIAYEELINSNISVSNLNILNYFSDELNGMKLIMYTFMPYDKFITHTGSLAAGYPGILFLINNDLLILILMYISFSIISIFPFVVYFFIILRCKYHYLLLFFIAFSITVHLKIFQSGNMHLLTNYKYILFYFFITILFVHVITKKPREKIEIRKVN